MIRLICNSEKIRYSAYHIIRAFLPDEDIRQEQDLPGGFCEDMEYLTVVDGNCNRLAEVSGPVLDKQETDRYIYDVFSKVTGRDLPWGVLTGVRPVKLAIKMLDSMDEDTFAAWFAKERYVSPKKARLCRRIAGTERNIIRGALGGKDRDITSYSLYVGIPVCPSICSYCSFSSGPLAIWKDRMDEYVDALTGEMKLLAGKLKGMTLTCVYIGGGTPTVLNEGQMSRLMDCLEEYYGAASSKEYTLEAGRPDTITEEKLNIAKAHGVSRLSINPQTMQQKTLDLVGRAHTTEQIYEAFAMARDAGFDNINMDVIAGLPGETAVDMEDSLRKIADLHPDSLTVHALAIKRASALARQSTPPEVIDKMIELGADAAASMGMMPYYMYRQKSIAGNHENTGYAIPGRESIYNVMIMEEVQSIAAFGAGATTKVLLARAVQNPDRAAGVMTNLLRQDNVSSISEYISRYKEMAEIKEKTFDKMNAPCYYT